MCSPYVNAMFTKGGASLMVPSTCLSACAVLPGRKNVLLELVNTKTMLLLADFCKMTQQLLDAILEGHSDSGVVGLQQDANAMDFLELSNMGENVLEVHLILLKTSSVTHSWRVYKSNNLIAIREIHSSCTVEWQTVLAL